MNEESVDFANAATSLLEESCGDLIDGCEKGLRELNEWLKTARSGRWKFWLGKSEREKARKARRETIEEVREELQGALKRFKAEDR
jgi:hypothetical protein